MMAEMVLPAAAIVEMTNARMTMSIRQTKSHQEDTDTNI